jgi:hypothetical protein
LRTRTTPVRNESLTSCGHKAAGGGRRTIPAIRRRLSFHSLDQVMPDVEQLLVGHTTVGRWSLGQILNHLTLTIRLPMDGVPVKFSWPVRRLFGPVARGFAFWLEWVSAGVRVPGIYLPQRGRDAAREAVTLQAVIERFGGFAGRWMGIRFWEECRQSGGTGFIACIVPITSVSRCLWCREHSSNGVEYGNRKPRVPYVCRG